MGYDTTFFGKVAITPALNDKEIEYINEFASITHVGSSKGPYFLGQVSPGDTARSDFPTSYCQWVSTDDGKFIEWDGNEKFYEATAWMEYLITHFLGSNPLAKKLHPQEYGFFQGHELNGTIKARGEDPEDRWNLVVTNNEVEEVRL